ncbi:hypothetical protein MA16_Dca022178 [Dendrobium catenatum]|uniref:Uncharacterized protein n=1 Tax=Dendrobium catenatum TaxID=906689 RepID=A0A2I0VXI0_9ASPA|nr:hypothetical protein MA16_Dca022178 [Dendrobium catenatum]
MFYGRYVKIYVIFNIEASLQENILLPSDFSNRNMIDENGDDVSGGTCATEVLRRTYKMLKFLLTFIGGVHTASR